MSHWIPYIIAGFSLLSIGWQARGIQMRARLRLITRVLNTLTVESSLTMTQIAAALGLGPGDVFPALDMLETAGLISSAWDRGQVIGPGQRIYRLVRR